MLLAEAEAANPKRPRLRTVPQKIVMLLKQAIKRLRKSIPKKAVAITSTAAAEVASSLFDISFVIVRSIRRDSDIKIVDQWVSGVKCFFFFFFRFFLFCGEGIRAVLIDIWSVLRAAD